MSEVKRGGGETEKGKYVVIEGPEGVGKTTQVELLVGHLAMKGIIARSDLREPGGTPEGERIRQWLKNPDIQRTPEQNLEKFNQARKLLHEQVIMPELENGKWVVCDRNRLSSHAYQGYGEGLDLGYVREECRNAIEGVEPDVELILWLDEAERRRRLADRGGTDYFEDLGDEFHQRVIRGYAAETYMLGISSIDGSGTPEQVHERIWQYVEPLTQNNYSNNTQV